MRMWFINPKLLCKSHLLGEHGEIHKHRHNFEKQHNMTGRIGQIDASKMEERHDELVTEMLRRGYNHKSPFTQPDTSYLKIDDWKIDLEFNIKDLKERCQECKRRIENEI